MSYMLCICIMSCGRTMADEQDCWRHELEVIKCDCRDRDRAVDTSEGSSDSE